METLEHKLLDHPFYQAWNRGEITKEQLSVYGASYMELVKNIPQYWRDVTSAFGVKNDLAKEVIQEETDHIPLWKQWIEKLPETKAYPRLQALFDGMDSMTPSEKMGALYAFEIQQPSVSKTKKHGLIEHYGFSDEDTIYFDEHMDEAGHTRFAYEMSRDYADKDEFSKGFHKGAKLFYDALDAFMPSPSAHAA